MNGYCDHNFNRPGEMPFGGHRALHHREDMPHGHRGGGFQTLPERYGGPGHPHGDRPPFGGPGGMPPRRPSPDFMRERIEEADLAELLELSGRMARHRPEGDPARGQNLILSILAGREALSQRELQQMLGVQPGSLSEILSKLERKGLITREKAEDRRGNLLRITDAGRQAIPQGEQSADGALFSALTEEQQSQLGQLLRTLLNDWITHLDDAPRRHGGMQRV